MRQSAYRTFHLFQFTEIWRDPNLVASCVVGSNKCDTQAVAKNQLHEVPLWVDQAIKIRKNIAEFAVRFSDGDSWHIHMKMVQNSAFEDYPEAILYLY